MREAIENFHIQFAFEPDIVYAEKLVRTEQFVVGGMGGSGHAADILCAGEPTLNMHVHRNYGVPHITGENAQEHLFIASSYSGNTEETLDFFQTVRSKNWPLAAYSTGGQLLEWAREYKIPHIVLPDVSIQPRSALGYSILALAKFIGNKMLYEELRALETVLSPKTFEKTGKEYAEEFSGFVPVIYTSSRNRAIANNWKIKLNETGKIPACYDVFPELNHNEIEGYSNAGKKKTPTDTFYFIFFTDTEDHPRVQKRMQITRELYNSQGLQTAEIKLEGQGRFERIFNSLLLADWTALYLAEHYGADPEAVPMVEEFKKKLGGIR